MLQLSHLRLCAFASVFLFAFATRADAAEVNQLDTYGFKLSLVDERWSIDPKVNAYFEDEFGGSWQVRLKDEDKIATVVLVATKAGALDMATIEDWQDFALNDDQQGFLNWYSEGHGFSDPPEWTESTAPIGSGQNITVRSTPTVNINGNKRQIRVAYLATETHWYMLVVYNTGRNKKFEDEWQTILGGLTIAGP